ncbi:serine/threonine protein kinase [Candidatus Woesearchaeota archaeon]|nr:serine/threonine protein kinase [Candidatus Woesearchaeota archaeon]
MAGDLEGEILGDYELQGRISESSASELYAAKNRFDDTPCAVKVFKKPASRLGPLMQSIDTRRKLKHPNIVTILDADEDNGKYYMAMEMCGKSLRQKIKSGPLPEEEAVNTAISVLKGLEYLHEQGFLSEAVRPENILECADDAKLLVAGTVQTKNYLSPEQEEGKRLSESTDIYSLGTVLYEALKGHRPVGAFESTGNTALDNVINKSRERKPDKRYQAAKEMQLALEQAVTVQDDEVAEDPQPAPAPEPTPEPATEVSPAYIRAAHIAIAGAGLIFFTILFGILAKSCSLDESYYQKPAIEKQADK